MLQVNRYACQKNSKLEAGKHFRTTHTHTRWLKSQLCLIMYGLHGSPPSQREILKLNFLLNIFVICSKSLGLKEAK